jgi:hypothetical protein
MALCGAALMCLTMLVGCGGSSTSGSTPYCKDVQSARDSFIGLLGNNITQEQFTGLLAALHTIRDEAPSNVKGAWATFSMAADTLSARLRRSGMTMDDIMHMQNGHMSSGPRMAAAMRAAQSLGSTAVTKAQAGIRGDVQKVCGINLDAA